MGVRLHAHALAKIFEQKAMQVEISTEKEKTAY
jgi:hypothetical protein